MNKYEVPSIFLSLLRTSRDGITIEVDYPTFSIEIQCFYHFSDSNWNFGQTRGENFVFPTRLAKMSSFHQKNGKNIEFQWKKLENQLRLLSHLGSTYRLRHILGTKYQSFLARITQQNTNTESQGPGFVALTDAENDKCVLDEECWKMFLFQKNNRNFYLISSLKSSWQPNSFAKEPI